MSNYSILIIDDNEIDRYVLKRQLERTGLPLTIFEQPDGEDAIRLLSAYEANRAKYAGKFPPILLFLDINMPKLDGWGFLREFLLVRSQYDYSTSVVVLFTSSDRPEDRAQGEQFDFVQNYLVKGQYDTEQLKTLILAAA